MFSGCFGERVPEGDKTEAGLHPAPGSLVSDAVLTKRLLQRLPIVDRSGSILVVSRANSDGSIVRYRPYGDLALPVLGYLDSYGRGLDGIEYTYDKVLMSNSTSLDPGQHEALELSLDRKIQALSEKNLRWQMKRLKASRGCQIVMDLQTGHIIAMASYNDGEKAGKGALTSNLALEDGLDPWALVVNLAWLRKIDRDLRAVADQPVEEEDGAKGDASSEKLVKGPWHWLSIGSKGKMWTRISQDDLEELSMNGTMLRQLIRLGMGQSTGIDLPGEKQGALPVSLSDNMTTIIDSGIDASPIQLLCTFSSIVQGGKRIHPRIGLVGEKDDSAVHQRVLSSDALQEYLEMIGDNHGPSIASVTEKTYRDGKGYEVMGIGMWPAKSPKISYITVLDNARIDPERRRGTLGRTASIAKAASLLPRPTRLATNMASRPIHELVARQTRGKAAIALSSRMPDLRGRSLRSALEAASQLGLKLEIRGAGTVRHQFPLPGSRIKRGSRCVIVCQS